MRSEHGLNYLRISIHKRGQDNLVDVEFFFLLFFYQLCSIKPPHEIIFQIGLIISVSFVAIFRTEFVIPPVIFTKKIEFLQSFYEFLTNFASDIFDGNFNFERIQEKSKY